MDPAAVFASLQALGGSPPYTVVVGCEVGSVDEGIGLTEPVASAVPRRSTPSRKSSRRCGSRRRLGAEEG